MVLFFHALIFLLRMKTGLKNEGYEIMEPTAKSVWFEGESRVIRVSQRLALEKDTVELCRIWWGIFQPFGGCRPLKLVDESDPPADQWTIQVPQRKPGAYFLRVSDNGRILALSDNFNILAGTQLHL